MSKEKAFTATIQIDGINPYVDVPHGVAETLGGGAKVRVKVKVAAADPRRGEAADEAPTRLAKDARRLKAIGRLAPGGWFRSTVLSRRSSPSRLYLDAWMRDAAGVAVGDRVRVTLRSDRAPRELSVPPALRDALEGNERAKAAWDRLAPSRRREILSYLNFLKTPAAVERNVRRAIAELLGETDRS